MQFSIIILVIGLGVCLARQPLPEEQRHMQGDFPSFEEVKKDLESHGTLKHPDVLGVYRPDEIPNVNPNTEKRGYKLFTGSRPICRERTIQPLHISIGSVAVVAVRDFVCENKGCFFCHGKYIGVCEKTYTYFTLRIRDFNGRWIWQSYRIPGCCKCVKK